MPRPAASLIVLPFLVTACGQADAPREVAASSPGVRIGDPAVAAAIGAPIMTDPGLAHAANAHVIRPPTTPDPLSFPPDVAQPAAPR